MNFTISMGYNVDIASKMDIDHHHLDSSTMILDSRDEAVIPIVLRILIVKKHECDNYFGGNDKVISFIQSYVVNSFIFEKYPQQSRNKDFSIWKSMGLNLNIPNDSRATTQTLEDITIIEVMLQARFDHPTISKSRSRINGLEFVFGFDNDSPKINLEGFDSVMLKKCRIAKADGQKIVGINKKEVLASQSCASEKLKISSSNDETNDIKKLRIIGLKALIKSSIFSLKEKFNDIFVTKNEWAIVNIFIPSIAKDITGIAYQDFDMIGTNTFPMQSEIWKLFEEDTLSTENLITNGMEASFYESSQNQMENLIRKRLCQILFKQDTS